MKINVKFEVEDIIFDQFADICAEKNRDINCVVEKVLADYVKQNRKEAGPVDFVERTKKRIPLWASNSSKNNHKILRAYFIAEYLADGGGVEADKMAAICGDKDRPDTYVEKFNGNYAQMKIDSIKSHGKVFDERGGIVTLYEETRETVLKYKKYFFNEDKEISNE